MHSFFSMKFLNFSEQLFYTTPVNRCLWFNWILVNFHHHLRFLQMPENFDHHSWFYRKYLEFWHSYETIWKPYLEHGIAWQRFFPEKYLHKWKPLALNFANIYSLKFSSRNLSHGHGNICCLPDQEHFGHYINKSTETELDFFIKYLLRAI